MLRRVPVINVTAQNLAVLLRNGVRELRSDSIVINVRDPRQRPPAATAAQKSLFLVASGLESQRVAIELNSIHLRPLRIPP